MRRARPFDRKGVKIGTFLVVVVVSLAASGCEKIRDPGLTLEQIRALHGEGRFAETIVPLRSLIANAEAEADAETIELERLLGVALMLGDSPSTAVWVLRRVAEHPAHTIDDLLVLAQAYGRGGAHREGLATVDRILEREAEHLGAHLLRLNLASHLKQWPAVVESADRILAIEPRRTMVYYAKAEALIASGLLDDAERTLRDGRASQPRRFVQGGLESDFCLLELGIERERGEQGEIDDLLATCLDRSGRALELLDFAVEYYDERGEPARADSLLARALEDDPVRFEIRKRLADRLERVGRSDEALALLLAATRLDGVAFQAWLMVADYHREKEDHASAARAVENVLVSRDAVPELVMAEYADDLIRSREIAKAEEVIAKISRSEWTSLLRGRLLLETGDARGAMDALQEGIRLWPGNGTARLLAGRAAERLGDFDWAISEYRDSVRSDVESTSAVYELASLHAEEGRFRSAYFPLNIRLQRNPDDGRAGLALVRIALAADNVVAAEGAAELLETNGMEQEASIARAMIAAANAGPLAAADLLADTALDLTLPENVEVLDALVDYEIASDRTGRAISRLTEIAALDPLRTELRSLLGRALRAAGRVDEAGRAYGEGLRLDPESSEALAGLATLAAESGEVQEAIALYDRAFEVDREHAAAAWNAILLAAGLEGEDVVDARLDALLYAHPRHVRAASLRATRLLERGADLDRAEELARRAIRFGGGAEALATAGRVALAQGDALRAVRLLRRSLELKPVSPSNRYFLGRALRTAGKPVAARASIEAALAAGADFAEAEAARAELAALARAVGGERDGGVAGEVDDE